MNTLFKYLKNIAKRYSARNQVYLANLAKIMVLTATMNIAANAQTVQEVWNWQELVDAAAATGSGDIILLANGIASLFGSWNHHLTIERDLTLNLNGKSLTITNNSGNTAYGIKIAAGVTLTIIDGAQGGGSITVTSNTTSDVTQGNGAAIDTSEGTLIIERGTITALSRHRAAAIGGGYGSSGGNIIINGGTVTATCEEGTTISGGLYGAGIGGGYGGDGGNITINGGIVTATGGDGAAGIGGGLAGDGGNIEINGGTVIATGGDVVTETGGDVAAAIGSGQSGSGGSFIINGDFFYLTNTTNSPPANEIKMTPRIFDDEDVIDEFSEFRYIEINVDGERVVTPVTHTKAETPENFRITGYQREGEANTGFYFDFDGKIPESGQLLMYVSETDEFESYSTAYYSIGDELYRSYSSYISGATYYARLQIYDPTMPPANNARYSDYSNTLSFIVAAPAMSALSATVKPDNIRLYWGSNNATGYNIWRLTDGEEDYQRLANTTEDTYLDVGLKANTKYTYRIRPYYYNTKTDEILYGGYIYREYVTNGNALNLKHNFADGKNVELTWNIVEGATGYKIYRINASSVYDEIRNGEYNGFSNYELIHTIHGGNIQTFTDEDVRENTSYMYRVEAVLSYLNNEGSITETATVNTSFRNVTFRNDYQRSDGSRYVEWHKVVGAEGYIVDKRNQNGEWELFETFDAETYSTTLPAAELGFTDAYRIKAYFENEMSSAVTISVISQLPVVQTVSASQTDGGIKISWSAVPEASYYRVFRTIRNTIYDWNADGGYYINTIGAESEIRVYQYVNVTQKDDGYFNVSDEGRTDRFTTTEIDDLYYRTSENNYVGPRPGQTYYYYVVAYAADYLGNMLARSLGSAQIANATYSLVSTPAAPTITVAAGESRGQAVVSVNAAVPNAAGYKIYRSQTETGVYGVIGSIEEGLLFTDVSLEPGKTYFYKALAYRANELGADIHSAFSQTVKYMESATVTVVVNPVEAGTATADPSETFAGATVTLAANANSGYTFAGWTVNSGDVTLSDATETDATFEMPADAVTLTANFTLNTYNVAFSAAGNGSGEILATVDGVPIADGDDIKEGSDIIFTATSASNNRIIEWKHNGSTVANHAGSVYTLSNLHADAEITVEFRAALPFDKFALVKWGNTLMLNIVELERSGINLPADLNSACTWWEILPDGERNRLGNGSAYHAPGGRNALKTQADGVWYYFEIQTANGIQFSTNKQLDDDLTTKSSLLAYPNPLQTGSALTLEGVETGSLIEVFNTSGLRVYSTIATGEPVTLTLNLPAGVYLIRTVQGEIRVVINN